MFCAVAITRSTREEKKFMIFMMNERLCTIHTSWSSSELKGMVEWRCENSYGYSEGVVKICEDASHFCPFVDHFL